MKPGTPRRSAGRFPWLVVGSLLVILLGLLVPRARVTPAQKAAPATGAGPTGIPAAGTAKASSGPVHPFHLPAGASAELVVADKLARFCKKRRAIVHALAQRAKTVVPALVEQFSDALEAGRLDEAAGLFKSLNEFRNSPGGKDVLPFWRAIVEAHGAAGEVQSWPAQPLLDYGNAVLGALRPGMVYMGGTDSGCFIPLLLNETGEGEPHVMLTQNALTSDAYLDYLAFLYGDRLTPLTSDDRQQALDAYLADRQQRLARDQASPDEPPQIRPGEDIQVDDAGQVQLSGQVATMLTSQRLVQRLMELNPDLSFALEESFPLKGTYAQAAPLGPVMELGAAVPNALTPETAAASLAYWQSTTDQLLADPDAASSKATLEAYAKMLAAQANLFVSHALPGEAEQALCLANQLSPADPVVVFRYVQLLAQQGRWSEALEAASGAQQITPDYPPFQNLVQQLQGRVAGQ